MTKRARGGRCIRKVASKSLEDIEHISLRSSSRAEIAISTPNGSTTADRDVEATRKRQEASGNLGTTVKSNNLKHPGNPTFGLDIVDGFTHELHDRRWASDDLVDHAFDPIVSISLAAKITLCFLHYGIISVQDGENEVARDDWPIACSHAAHDAHIVFKAKELRKRSRKQSSYHWSWSKPLNQGTEKGAQDFLNIVGVLGFIFGNLFDLDITGLSKRRLRTRISTLPRPHNAMPLASADGQDCRPDFFALHRNAFFTASERDSAREEYIDKSSILSTIRSAWPQLSETYPKVFSSSSQKDGTKSRGSKKGGIVEGTKDGVKSRGSKKGGIVEGNITSSEEVDSLRDLNVQLEQLLRVLEAKDACTLSESVFTDVKRYDDAKYLDTSAVCFPNVLAAGEAKQTEMKAATVQVTVYMRQQRRTQSWLRFCLGLVATKDKMGLLRADATGTEEYTFSKDRGGGVIESIRLSLGILIATDEELGQHPSFSLRAVTIANPFYEKDSAVVGTKRSAVHDDTDRDPKKRRSQTSRKMPSTSTKTPPWPKQCISREVNWITIDKEKLHGRLKSDEMPTHETPTTFYVKYLVEDRGSLTGRCTRVWCVYQEVFQSDLISEQNRHQIPNDARVFRGPYALKIYNADMCSEAFEQDILLEVLGKRIPGVLLPTHVWYLGEVLTLVRDLTEDKCPSGIPVKRRQEIFTLSPFKRTLSQFETMEEYYDAIIGVCQAIQSLEENGIIHRDISFGNIILNKEIYCDTDEECQLIEVKQENAQLGSVALIRRANADIGTIGGLHDLDMAAYIPKEVSKAAWKLFDAEEMLNVIVDVTPISQSQQKPNRDWRTGTLPFMSISLLCGGQNSVIDDLQSLFFVCYLSLFTFDDRLPNCFANMPPTLDYRWPADCRKWTDSTGHNMADLGLFKQDFFLAPAGRWVTTIMSHALSLWNTSDPKNPGHTTLGEMHKKMLGTFYKQLWILGRPTAILLENNPEVTPLSILTALREVKDKLGTNDETQLKGASKGLRQPF